MQPPKACGAQLAGFVTNLGQIEQSRNALSASNLTTPQRILRLLADTGPDVLHVFRGNFAILAIDQTARTVWAFRDRLGSHSLYFSAPSARDQRWVIGNSAKEVLLASGRPFEEDPDFISSLFAHQATPPTGHCAFRGITAVLPGELVEIRDDNIRRERQPIVFNPWPTNQDDAQSVEQFRSLLDTSVKHCLSPQADTAVMLSGGLDSGPVAHLADLQLQQTRRRLRPISWTLRDFPEADEAFWTKKMATRLSEDVAWLESSADLPFCDLENSPVNPESPAFNAFRPLINQCYRVAARQGCEVILNGNAGDDIYHPYALLYKGYVKNREYKYLFENLRIKTHSGGLRSLTVNQPLRHWLAGWLRELLPRRRPPWLSEYAVQRLPEPEAWPPESRKHPFPMFVRQLYGPRMTEGRAIEWHQAMACGVERRDPYQNEELVEFMLNSPFSLSFRHGRNKWIMREAMKNILPESVRLKRRTGVLTSFYLAGRRRNHSSIRTFLFEKHKEWQRWVKPSAVSEILEESGNTETPETLLNVCIGYVKWRRYWTERQN